MNPINWGLFTILYGPILLITFPLWWRILRWIRNSSWLVKGVILIGIVFIHAYHENQATQMWNYRVALLSTQQFHSLAWNRHRTLGHLVIEMETVHSGRQPTGTPFGIKVHPIIFNVLMEYRAYGGPTDPLERIYRWKIPRVIPHRAINPLRYVLPNYEPRISVAAFVRNPRSVTHTARWTADGRVYPNGWHSWDDASVKYWILAWLYQNVYDLYIFGPNS